jgi:hypothetical protein
MSEKILDTEYSYDSLREIEDDIIDSIAGIDEEHIDEFGDAIGTFRVEVTFFPDA